MVTTNKISEYIEKNQIRKSVHWKCSEHQNLFYHEGIWYDEAKFDDLYPEYEYIKFNDKGDNPDKTRIV